MTMGSPLSEALREALGKERTVYRHCFTGEEHPSGEKSDLFRGYTQASITSVGLLTGINVSGLGSVDSQRINTVVPAAAVVMGFSARGCTSHFFVMPRSTTATWRLVREHKLHHCQPSRYLSFTDAAGCLSPSVTRALGTNKPIRQGARQYLGSHYPSVSREECAQ